MPDARTRLLSSVSNLSSFPLTGHARMTSANFTDFMTPLAVRVFLLLAPALQFSSNTSLYFCPSRGFHMCKRPWFAPRPLIARMRGVERNGVLFSFASFPALWLFYERRRRRRRTRNCGRLLACRRRAAAERDAERSFILGWFVGLWFPLSAQIGWISWPTGCSRTRPPSFTFANRLSPAAGAIIILA